MSTETEDFVCPRSIKFDVLLDVCHICEFKERCEKEHNEGKPKVDVDEVKIKVRNELVITEDKLNTYKACMGTVNNLIGQYGSLGLRKRKGWRERKFEVKPELKSIGKFPITEGKLELVIDCAEYVFFGDKE
jgi:hypothetical protein